MSSAAILFCFTAGQELSFLAHHHLSRQKVALTGTRQLRSQSPVSVHTHFTEGVTRSEGREGANGARNGVEGGNGNGDGGGAGTGMGTRTGTGTRTETGTGGRRENERKIGTVTGAGAGTGTGA